MLAEVEGVGREEDEGAEKQSREKLWCKSACELPRRVNWFMRPSSKGKGRK